VTNTGARLRLPASTAAGAPQPGARQTVPAQRDPRSSGYLPAETAQEKELDMSFGKHTGATTTDRTGSSP
jgi:hypothetical protein